MSTLSPSMPDVRRRYTHRKLQFTKSATRRRALVRVCSLCVGRADLMRLRLIVALLFLASRVHASEDAEERFFCPQWCLQRAWSPDTNRLASQPAFAALCRSLSCCPAPIPFFTRR